MKKSPFTLHFGWWRTFYHIIEVVVVVAPPPAWHVDTSDLHTLGGEELNNNMFQPTNIHQHVSR